jgi:GNAT superfamily N-acetyltransferase
MIRNAVDSDKSPILNFCQDTFSWGDYIQDIWNYWLSEGNLLIVEKEFPVGVIHAMLSNNQVWIEGIRINPNFRRQGLATKLVQHVELLAKENKIQFSYMLIDIENLSSLSLAKNLDYDIFQTWNFYTLIPQINNGYEIKFENNFDQSKIPQYVKSWRWLILDKKTLSSFYQQKKIIFSDKSDPVSIAILTDSEHFDKILVVTLISGSSSNTLNLISYIQNYGAENNYRKIQILTKETLPMTNFLDHKITFNLMHKSLS